MAISNIKSIQKGFSFSRKEFSVTLYNSLLIHLLGCNTYHTYQVNTHLPEQSGVVDESIHGSTFSNDQSSNTSQDKLPIMLCWLPNDYGSTLPGLDHGDQLLSADNYMDIILEHKKKGEPRKIFLFINGPGLRGDQVYELKKLAQTVQGIEIVDLHDSKYNAYWEEIDEGWQIDKKPIKIKEYFSHSMYSMSADDKMFFPVAVDTFRHIAAYILLRYQQDKGKNVGLVYIDFDTLAKVSYESFSQFSHSKSRGGEFQGIGKNITITYGMTVRPIATIEGKAVYNDLFAVNKCLLLKEILGLLTKNRFFINKKCERRLNHIFRF